MKVRQDFQANFYKAMDARIQAKKVIREYPEVKALNVNLSEKSSNRALFEYPPELCWLWSKDHEDLLRATKRRAVSFNDLVTRSGGYVAKFRHAGFVYRISVFFGLLLRA